MLLPACPCKTAIRGFDSRPRLLSCNDLRSFGNGNQALQLAGPLFTHATDGFDSLWAGMGGSLIATVGRNGGKERAVASAFRRPLGSDAAALRLDSGGASSALGGNIHRQLGRICWIGSAPHLSGCVSLRRNSLRISVCPSCWQPRLRAGGEPYTARFVDVEPNLKR